MFVVRFTPRGIGAGLRWFERVWRRVPVVAARGVCAGVIVLCGACADFGDTSPPVAMIDVARMSFSESTSGLRQDARVWPGPQWWREFGDARLDHLIESALRDNIDIGAAAARVRAAQQVELALGARTDPQLALNMAVERDRYSENYLYADRVMRTPHTEARLTLDFSYEFDFWGRQRAMMQAARQRLDAARAEQESARLIVALAVARTYVQLQGAFTEQALADERVHQLDDIVKLNQLRARRGLLSQAALQAYIARLAQASHSAEASAFRIEAFKHELAALLGAGPDALADLTSVSWRDAPLSMPGFVPADLLGRRADIQAWRLHVEAAASDVAQARAEFYPNIDIGGFLGFESLGTADWLRGDSHTFGVGPALHLPLFNRAALRGRLGARQAEFDLAVGAYNQSVLDALRDAADQISALRALERQRPAVDGALAALEKSRVLCALRQKRGLATRLELFDAELAVNSQRQARNDQRENEWLVALNLIRALGGGYTAQELTHHD